MKRLLLGAACAASLSGVSPAVAAADILDTTVSSTSSAARTCQDRLFAAGSAGVVQRDVVATASGLVRARLSGSGTGDWDVAVFDRLSG